MIQLEKRPQPSKAWTVATPILAVILTMIFGGIMFTRRQRADGARRIKRQAIGFGHLSDLPRQIVAGRWVLHAKRHVLGDIKCIKEREMLEHHCNTRGARRTWFRRCIGRAAQGHRALVWFHQAVDHLDQRRLASAVFSQQRVDFPFADVEGHVVIGDNAWIGFGQA